MPMSRKDYVAIADALYRSNEDFKVYTEKPTSAKDIHGYLCYAVADALIGTNPRFDRQRFLTACGVN